MDGITGEKVSGGDHAAIVSAHQQSLETELS